MRNANTSFSLNICLRLHSLKLLTVVNDHPCEIGIYFVPIIVSANYLPIPYWKTLHFQFILSATPFECKLQLTYTSI